MLHSLWHAIFSDTVMDCMQKGDEPGKFRQLDEIIYIDGYPGYQSLSSIAEKTMPIVCDLKGTSYFFSILISSSMLGSIGTLE